MLSVYKLSLRQAKTYYSKDNYYTQQVGELYGKSLNHLSLRKDDLTHDNFVNLLEGINPITGEQLTAKRNDKSVPGFDFTFSAPKSLSIVVEAAKIHDKNLASLLENLHDKAVNQTLNLIEKEHIKTRIQKKKKTVVEYTGNMVASKFQHDISRALDPQLHTHCVTMNMTLCSDGKYRTLDMASLLKRGSPIVKNLGKYYRQLLKQELQKAGIEIETTNKKENFFELKQVDKRLLDEFSKRRKAIENEVKRLEKKYPDMSKSELWQTATLNSRDSKKNIDRDKVRKDNLKAMIKHIKVEDMLTKIKQNVKTPKKYIDKKSLTKIIKKAEKQIKNRYHNTIDNVTDKVITLLPNNVNIDIESIRETIKISKELQLFKKEDLKPLKTMHDVAKFQLRKTRFDTGVLQKVKKLSKEEREEIIENVRSKTKSRVKTGNANQITKRYFTKLIRDSKKTRGVYLRNPSKFKDFDRDITTKRGRGIAERRWRFKFKRFDVNSNRSNRRVKKSINITRGEMRSDTKRIQKLSKEKTVKKER